MYEKKKRTIVTTMSSKRRISNGGNNGGNDGGKEGGNDGGNDQGPPKRFKGEVLKLAVPLDKITSLLKTSENEQFSLVNTYYTKSVGLLNQTCWYYFQYSPDDLNQFQVTGPKHIAIPDSWPDQALSQITKLVISVDNWLQDKEKFTSVRELQLRNEESQSARTSAMRRSVDLGLPPQLSKLHLRNFHQENNWQLGNTQHLKELKIPAAWWLRIHAEGETESGKAEAEKQQEPGEAEKQREPGQENDQTTETKEEIRIVKFPRLRKLMLTFAPESPIDLTGLVPSLKKNDNVTHLELCYDFDQPLELGGASNITTLVIGEKERSNQYDKTYFHGTFNQTLTAKSLPPNLQKLTLPEFFDNGGQPLFTENSKTDILPESLRVLHFSADCSFTNGEEAVTLIPAGSVDHLVNLEEIYFGSHAESVFHHQDMDVFPSEKLRVVCM